MAPPQDLPSIPGAPHSLSHHIRSSIAQSGGSIPFHQFMDAALYHPDWGYYSSIDSQVGQTGDFCTSVSTGPLFGELLALEFLDAFHELTPSSHPTASHPLWLIEAGAHDGQLAHDILNALARIAPEISSRVQHLILEPSPRRSQRQQTTLAPFAPRCHWASEWHDAARLLHPPAASPLPIALCYSNELLDAFPIQRFGWDASQRAWFEWHVAVDPASQTFVWRPGPRVDPRDLPQFLDELPPPLSSLLPNHFTVDTSPDALAWWSLAARTLPRGRLYAIDYGVAQSLELLQPHRAQGTLRAYRNQRLAAHELADPGAQDLTCHVDFQAVRQTAESEGWTTLALEPQSRFLTRIAQRHASTPHGLHSWRPHQTRQFQSLISPAFFGRNFWTLVQERK